MVIIGAGPRRLQGSDLSSRRSPRRALPAAGPLALALALALTSALAGCSSGGSAPVRHGTAGEAEGSVRAADDSWAAKLSESDKLLYVTTYNGSICPSFLTAVKLADGDHLEATAEVENPKAACTADIAPWTSSIAVPESVFTNPTVRVTLAGYAEDISLIAAK